MGGFFGGGESSQSTENKPWEPSISHLEKILAEMGGWYDSAKNEGYISQTGDLNGIYGQYLNQLQQSQGDIKDKTENAWNQGMASLEGTQSFYDKMMNGGGDITSEDITNMANDFIDNDMLNGQIDAANRDTARNLMENTLPGIDREAVGGGNMGSSRAGVSAAVAERGANDKMADTSAAMRGQAYNNALGQAQSVLTGNLANQYGAAQGMGNTTNQYFNASNNAAGNTMGGLSGYLSSAQLQSMLQASGQADKIGNRDFLSNLLSQYTNIAGSIGGMGGTSNTTGTGGGTSAFDKLLQLGQTAGSMWAASDRRFKDNITKVDEIKGVDIVTWDWNEVAEEVHGLTGSGRGVIAQDIMEDYPTCVEMFEGYYAVNYSLLERKLGQPVL